MIPKIIYQTWKSKNIPENTQRVRDAIQALNPEYEMVLYDDNEIDQFIKDNFSSYIYNCYSQLNIGASRADFWRYCILHKNGGVYLDMDAGILKPLRELIRGDEQCIVTREGNAGVFNNWIMIFEKNHPIMLEAILKCCDNITNRISNNVVELTVKPLTDAINKVMCKYYKPDVWNLYFETDNNLNAALDDPKNHVRCRFYKVDMGEFACWKHEYAQELYQEVPPWWSYSQTFKV